MKGLVRSLWIAVMVLLMGPPWKIMAQQEEDAADAANAEDYYKPGELTGHIVSCRG